MSEDSKRIPISAGKRICDEYGYDQVVIFARKVGENGKEHVTTYGRTVEHCDVAAQMGNALKRHVGWPESKCQDLPSRIRKRAAAMSEERCESCRKVLGRGWKYDSAGEVKLCPRCYAELDRTPSPLPATREEQ